MGGQAVPHGQAVPELGKLGRARAWWPEKEQTSGGQAALNGQAVQSLEEAGRIYTKQAGRAETKRAGPYGGACCAPVDEAFQDALGPCLRLATCVQHAGRVALLAQDLRGDRTACACACIRARVHVCVCACAQVCLCICMCVHV